MNIGIIENKRDPTLFAVHSGDRTDDGSWPSYDLENDKDIDFQGELVGHLLEGQVAVLMSAGADKLRYISGSAVAVNHEGHAVTVSLDDIYATAASYFGVTEKEITLAEY